ncbi:hypothetical protein GNI_049870 [Gregarina niphandrodes]|uniref:Oocyst wall protein n=1 Tax=Gregarina niphandrodes TaxID=110365 RepID=A0A023B9R5_GRENI|nr:hypothetical protein GNI_049870 [Gregarina niphandrodes]EZG73010.1 hypothetical protein GNI_049870 [Gregarina niphandrodes]|eukprot:XP_011129705.1 hypothetical protein GNI_049870 [Gregarina niphandrodes]
MRVLACFVAVFAEQDLQGRQKAFASRGYYGGIAPPMFEPALPGRAFETAVYEGPYYDQPAAVLYEDKVVEQVIQQPVQICPRQEYVLVGDECCRELRVDCRIDCPASFRYDGFKCFQFYEPTIYCPVGHLMGSHCHHVEYVEARYECPLDTIVDVDGSCFAIEQLPPVEICPGSTIRSKNGCLAVEYSEPALVCPPDTVPDGKRCRREIINWKMKKGRRLSEEGEDEELEAMGKRNAFGYEELSFGDLYADISIAGPVNECLYGDCLGEWLPATPEVKIKTKKVKQPIVSEQMKWEKVKVPVTTAKVKDVKVKVPDVKVKPIKEKPAKTPHEVVKVVTQAAEKVCPFGQKHGSTCVAETIVPPVLECPLPGLGPNCSRKIPVPSVPVCASGDLMCDAVSCRCATYQELLPETACAGGHRLLDGHCIIEVAAETLCPIGFFLDSDGTCVRADCEPALSIVAVPNPTKAVVQPIFPQPVTQPPPMVAPMPMYGRPMMKKGKKLMDDSDEYYYE